MNYPELVTVVGVVVVVGAERSAGLGRLGLIPTMLHVWLCGEHNLSLALHILGLGLLLFRISGWELKEGEASLLSSRALCLHVQHL